MIVAGRHVRIFDPFLLLLWSAPLAQLVIDLVPPLYPWGAAQYSFLKHGFSYEGFPIAYTKNVLGGWTGANAAAIIPYWIDLLVGFTLVHIVGLAIFRPPNGIPVRAMLFVFAIFAWPLAYFLYAWTWDETFDVSWWIHPPGRE